MYLLSRERLSEYLRDDWIGTALAAAERSGDSAFAAHRWLIESAPKRLMYHAVYGDLLAPDARPRRILDVGGGFCSLTRTLLGRHDYHLMEISAHDVATALRAEEDEVGRSFWLGGDWCAQSLDGPYDIVIANDLFPNVDQRLGLFLDKILPVAREVQLSLT